MVNFMYRAGLEKAKKELAESIQKGVSFIRKWRKLQNLSDASSNTPAISPGISMYPNEFAFVLLQWEKPLFLIYESCAVAYKLTQSKITV